MTDDEMRQAFAVVAIGIEAEKFISSDIGKYILAKAEDEREKAINSFKGCDVTNSSEVLRLQNGINIPDKIVAWLVEAIDVGYVKHMELREAEDCRREQTLS